MRRLFASLAMLLVVVGSTAEASDHPGAKRFTISVRAGSFDEQGSGVMLRKDGEPGNPLLGWKASDQVAGALAFDIRPGLTLELCYARLDVDFGSDLVVSDPDSGFVSTQIATGTLDEYRLAVMFDVDLLNETPTYYVSPERTTRWRFAVGGVIATTTAGDLTPATGGAQLLGIESIETGRQSSLGLGARIDYRLGRSGLTVGSSVGWMWCVSGDLITLRTSDESPYAGSTLQHEGLDFLLDLSFHF
jgi:hypothetical protein